MDTDDASLAALLDAYRDAVHAKDVDAFVALYDDDVLVFDLWSPGLHDGRDAWRRNTEGWFGALGDERVAVSFESVRTIASESLAAVHAFVIYRALAADGRPLRAMRNRLTWVLRRAERGWRIVHEHTSAPIDGETTKAKLAV